MPANTIQLKSLFVLKTLSKIPKKEMSATPQIKIPFSLISLLITKQHPKKMMKFTKICPNKPKILKPLKIFSKIREVIKRAANSTIRYKIWTNESIV
jgi:hypothetical protein